MFMNDEILKNDKHIKRIYIKRWISLLTLFISLCNDDDYFHVEL